MRFSKRVYRVFPPDSIDFSKTFQTIKIPLTLGLFPYTFLKIPAVLRLRPDWGKIPRTSIFAGTLHGFILSMKSPVPNGDII